MVNLTSMLLREKKKKDRLKNFYIVLFQHMTSGKDKTMVTLPRVGEGGFNE